MWICVIQFEWNLAVKSLRNEDLVLRIRLRILIPQKMQSSLRKENLIVDASSLYRGDSILACSKYCEMPAKKNTGSLCFKANNRILPKGEPFSSVIKIFS
ncbi:hypothetical protein CEXT_425221 [Caerostris extrusa]|uniref:Uncharacterized protein n=1 Tax=Caerostris extrusa TaxID=172846 RepID=A0AAV4WZM1_CAEEX|nr:hypothetical protein CEXT_425221 [Caerostris extrusa]